MEEKPAPDGIHPLNLVLTALAGFAVLTGVIYLGIYLYHNAHYEETNDAQVEAFINPISARAGGYIREVKFNEHQEVKQGDTLVILDDREYKIRVLEAKAAVEDVNAQLAVLQADIQVEKNGTEINRNQIAAAKTRLWQLQKEISRYRNLMKEEAVTGQEFDVVTAKHDVAASELDASKNTLFTNESKVAGLEKKRGLLHAQLKLKDAQLAYAELNLSYTVITAPANGILGRKTILQGQQIQPGQSLVSIVNGSEVWVTANFKETQVSGMYVGQPVEISIDALDGKKFKGNIEAISATTGSKVSVLPADNSSGNFVKIIQRIPVRIHFEPQGLSPVRAGMNVTVSVRNN